MAVGALVWKLTYKMQWHKYFWCIYLWIGTHKHTDRHGEVNFVTSLELAVWSHCCSVSICFSFIWPIDLTLLWCDTYMLSQTLFWHSMLKSWMHHLSGKINGYFNKVVIHVLLQISNVGCCFSKMRVDFSK